MRALLDFQSMPLRRNRLASVLAMLAMALQVFWPLLAQAQPNDPTSDAPICSVQGDGSRAGFSGGNLPAGDGAGHHQKHCKLCFGGFDRVQVLVPAPCGAFRSQAFVVEAPAALPAASVRSTSASPAQPRAPPAFS
jgi:hypothetical protein